jgi:hypothetical protein
MSDRIELRLAKAASVPPPEPAAPAEPEREEAPVKDAKRLLARLTRDMRLADAELDRVHQAAEGIADHHRESANKLAPHLLDLHAGPTADEYGDHLRDAFQADVLANDGEYLDRLASHATLAKADQPSLWPGLVPTQKIVRRKTGRVHTQTFHTRPDEAPAPAKEPEPPPVPPAIADLLSPDRHTILDVSDDSEGTLVRYTFTGTEAWPTTKTHPLPRRYDPAIAREQDDGTFALQPGWSESVPPTDDRLMYRGMSWEEWQEAQRTGVIRSRGDLNALDGQEGYTCFAHDVGTSVAYATGFAPAKYQPAVGKPGVLIAVPREPGVHLPHQSSGEVNIESVPLDRVQRVWEAHPYAVGAKGTTLMAWAAPSRMGVTSGGGGAFDPGERYAWRDATPAAPREHYPTVPTEADWKPQRMTEPTRLYRSVSLAEAADILTRGSIRGGGNTFNPFDTRRHVFFGAAPSPAVLGSGEDVRRQVEYAMRDSPLAEKHEHLHARRKAVFARFRDDLVRLWEILNERRVDQGRGPRVSDEITLDELREANYIDALYAAMRVVGRDDGVEGYHHAYDRADEALRAVGDEYRARIDAVTGRLTAALKDAPFTSVTLRTRPVTGGLEYKPDAKGEGSGMPGESEFAFPPDAITLDDLEGAYLVRRPRPSADAEIVREVTLDELREALRAFAVPTAHALHQQVAGHRRMTRTVALDDILGQDTAA